MHTKYPLIKFRTLLFTALITALMFAEATSFHLTTRKGLLSFELHSNQQQYDSQAVEDMERKMAWAKHTVMTVAASIMGVPTDVFTTPPMVDPKPPSTPSERLLREKINVRQNFCFLCMNHLIIHLKQGLCCLQMISH
jgi:hypothetical protein